MKTFNITVQASAIVSATITVEAETKEEAIQKAEHQADTDAFSDMDWEIDSIEGPVDTVRSEELTKK